MFGIWSVKQHPGGIVPSHGAKARTSGTLGMWKGEVGLRGNGLERQEVMHHYAVAESPFRRVTFSVVSQPQDPHQGSLQSCYDSGLEESETPSSKSSSGPRLGALPLPEDAYERTTPDGSVGISRDGRKTFQINETLTITLWQDFEVPAITSENTARLCLAKYDGSLCSEEEINSGREARAQGMRGGRCIPAAPAAKPLRPLAFFSCLHSLVLLRFFVFLNKKQAGVPLEERMNVGLLCGYSKEIMTSHGQYEAGPRREFTSARGSLSLAMDFLIFSPSI
ncbi:hypothetical protein QQF64_029978 [Cirrhinus molitorella]|uniref:Uncharacterized protein n=1 Tax=Cirrhinus molitorella TaxID=172907 RepID=A0ABR3N205_9TELE